MKTEVNGYSIEIPDPPVVEGWEAVEYRIPRKGEVYWTHLFEISTALANGDFTAWIMRRRRVTRRVVRFVECEEAVRDNKHPLKAFPYLASCGSVCFAVSVYDKPSISCWLRREDSVEEVEG